MEYALITLEKELSYQLSLKRLQDNPHVNNQLESTELKISQLKEAIKILQSERKTDSTDKGVKEVCWFCEEKKIGIKIHICKKCKSLIEGKQPERQ